MELSHSRKGPPSCVLGCLMCGHNPGARARFDSSKRPALGAAVWQRRRGLCRLSRSDHLPREARRHVSVSGRLREYAPGNSFLSPPGRCFRDFFPLAETISLLVSRLALVFGNAGPDDWHCSSRATTACRPLYLLASDWFVPVGGLGRCGFGCEVAFPPRGYGRSCRGRSNGACGRQLRTDFILEKQRNALAASSGQHDKESDRRK